MKKRVFCLLLAAALLCSGALAAGQEKHSVKAICDSRFGSVSVDSAEAAVEDNIYFHVTVKAGYLPENPKITTASGKAVQCYVSGTEGAVHSYYFLMPDEDVTISVSFTIEDAPFDDVTTADWFCDEVLTACKAGIMSGTGERTFSPNTATDRGMLVTMLWRMAGSPELASAAAFIDVAEGEYYAKAVGWASENGIVEGYEDGTFRPASPITREQFAAILYRYAKHSGADVSKTAELTKFSDAGSVGSWAIEAMKWAVARGIIGGAEGNLISPQGNATRAQTAVMLVRYSGLN